MKNGNANRDDIFFVLAWIGLTLLMFVAAAASIGPAAAFLYMFYKLVEKL